MTCERCGGFILETIQVTDEGTMPSIRCLNCGRTPEEAARSPKPQPPAKPVPQAATITKEDDPMPQATSATCTWPAGCEDDPAENSRYCPDHRDMKKRANDNQKRKREGLPPLPSVGRPGRKKKASAAHDAPLKNASTSAETPEPAEEPVIISRAHPVPASKAADAVNWVLWKQSVLDQINQAIATLEEQLTKTKAARAALEEL